MRTLQLFCLFVCAVVAPALSVSAGGSPPAAAIINDTVITQKELDVEVQRLLPQSYFHQSITQEKLDALREKALNTLIDNTLKLQEAQKIGLQVPDREIEEGLQETISRYPDRRTFEERMKKSHFTLQDIKEEIRKRKLLTRVYEKEIVQQVHIDEETAQNYYEKNPEKFIQPSRLHLKKLLIKVPPLATEKEKDALRQKADRLAEKIRKTELDFNDAVRQYSEGKNKDREGDMGLVHKGRLKPEIEATLFSLKDGEIAGPFQTFRGFALFQRVEILPERNTPFGEIKEKMIQDLTQKMIEDHEKKWIKELREKARIDIPTAP